MEDVCHYKILGFKLCTFFHLVFCFPFIDLFFGLFHLFMQDGQTALDEASFNGHHKVVELLLGAGANPDLQDVVRKRVCPVKQGGILRISDISFVAIAIQIDWSTQIPRNKGLMNKLRIV